MYHFTRLTYPSKLGIMCWYGLESCEPQATSSWPIVGACVAAGCLGVAVALKDQTKCKEALQVHFSPKIVLRWVIYCPLLIACSFSGWLTESMLPWNVNFQRNAGSGCHCSVSRRPYCGSLLWEKHTMDHICKHCCCCWRIHCHNKQGVWIETVSLSILCNFAPVHIQVIPSHYRSKWSIAVSSHWMERCSSQPQLIRDCVA